jgi:hypothetical protein
MFKQPQGVEPQDVDLLIDIYKRAEQKILDKIEGSDLVGQRKQGILAEIRQILIDLEKPTVDFIAVKSKAEYIDGLDGAEFKVIDKQAVDALVENAKVDINTALGQTYQNVANKMSVLTNEVRREVLVETGSALITGESRKEVSKRLYNEIRAKGITGFASVDKNGKPYNLSLEAYSKGLALSTMRNARITSIIQTAQRLGTDLVKGSSHGDQSPICKPYAGRIMSISGESTEYPSLMEAMTWFAGGKMGFCNHTYCRHTITPYFEL